ncbi:MAG: hypothetical protein V4503_09160 [Gemmatimonadota bacterium]
MTARLPALIALTGTLLAGCSGNTESSSTSSASQVVTAATLDSLPRLTFTDGGRVCLADGRNLCPLQAAVANWLGEDLIALWEPGRPIGAWKIGDSVAMRVGALGVQVGEYQNPAAIGGTSSGDLLVIDAQTESLLRYDRSGKYIGSKPLPKLFGIRAWGFAGNLALLQRLYAADTASPATLELKILKTAGDTGGRVALTTTIPWLRLNDDVVSATVPLFPTQPVYAVGEDGAVVWSPADRFAINGISPRGTPEWSISSNLTGPPIDSTEISARRAQLAQQDVPAIDLDSMVAKTPATSAAVTGILINRDGRILVGRATSGDSAEYVMFSKTGEPLSRLVLGSRIHPLLLSGDSMLVHRPTDEEPWEVRWLLLSKTP